MRNRGRVALTRWGLIGSVLAFCLFTLPAWAYMYFPSGIGHIPVVHEGKVYFCQADDTLTVLRLEDGSVIHRLNKPEGIHSTLACPAGLIAMGWERTYLLDWQTLEPIWEAEDASLWQTHVLPNDLLLMHIDDGLAGLDTRTGKPRWSLPGFAMSVVIVGDQAMVVQVHGQPVDHERPTIIKLNVQTGEVLERHTFAKPDWQSEIYAFDGERMYVIEQDTYESEENRAWTIDRAGILLPEPKPTTSPDKPDIIQVGDRRFWHDGQPVLDGHRLDVNGVAWGEPDGQWYFDDAKIRLFDESLKYPDGRASRLRTEGAYDWRLVIPHLPPNEHEFFLMAHGDRLLLWTTCGQLECLDISTGQSQWLYVSSWVRATLSISGGSGPLLSTLVSEFDRQKSSADKRTPSRAVPADLDWSALTDEALIEASPPPGATVIEDPRPFDPFDPYRQLLLGVRLVPWVIPVIGIGIAWWTRRRMDAGGRSLIVGIGSATCFLLAILVLYHLPHISMGASLALLIQAVLLAAAMLWSLRDAYVARRHRAVITALIVLTAISAVIAMPMLDWVFHRTVPM